MADNADLRRTTAARDAARLLLSRGPLMKRHSPAFLCVVIGIKLFATKAQAQPGPAPPPPATAEMPVGPPTGMLPSNAKPFEMKLTVVDKDGKAVTRTVRIPSNPPDPNQPPIMIWKPTDFLPGEMLGQRTERYRNERAEFARKKAAAIAYAVNQTFKDVFEGLPKINGQAQEAAAGQEPVRDNYGGQNIANGRDQLWGLILVPNVSQTVDQRTGKKEGVMYLKNPMGEGGDGVRFQRGTPGSLGSRGAMGRGESSTTVATGFDLNGDPSLVEFGIKENYIATLTPIPGMSDADILMQLKSMLDSNNIHTTYDPLMFQLALDDPIPNGDTLAFGNTDPGLDFMVSFQGVYEIPEPACSGLVAAALIPFLTPRRRWTRSNDGAAKRAAAVTVKKE